MKTELIVYAFLLAVAGCNSVENQPMQQDQAKLELLDRLKKSLQQNPDSSSLRMQYINALDSLQMYDQAIAQTDSMIKRDSLNNGLWFAKGQLFESNKDTAQAIHSYEKAVAIYPSVEAQLNLANLYAEQQNPKALAICQNISRLGLGRESDANCDFIAGVYHARKGNAAKALNFFDRAINNNYTLMEAYMEKGFLYFGNKKYDTALQVFETASSIENTYADAYYWKAKTFETMADKPQALLNYQKALGLDPRLTEARTAIKRLE